MSFSPKQAIIASLLLLLALFPLSSEFLLQGRVNDVLRAGSPMDDPRDEWPSEFGSLVLRVTIGNTMHGLFAIAVAAAFALLSKSKRLTLLSILGFLLVVVAQAFNPMHASVAAERGEFPAADYFIGQCKDDGLLHGEDKTLVPIDRAAAVIFREDGRVFFAFNSPDWDCEYGEAALQVSSQVRLQLLLVKAVGILAIGFVVLCA